MVEKQSSAPQTENKAVYMAKWIRDNSWTIDQIFEKFPRLMTKGMVGIGGGNYLAYDDTLFITFYKCATLN